MIIFSRPLAANSTNYFSFKPVEFYNRPDTFKMSLISRIRCSGRYFGVLGRMAQTSVYQAGLDIGSTTAKIALLDSHDTLIFSDYQRHHARINETTASFFKQILDRVGDCRLGLKLTGSAALGDSKSLDLPFG